ncbi:MAG: tetratricopeptide repeat protein [Magnetococcales bacterium]|nr:tetratricopeptide repeat protein [Magnetococcales bacterium]
MFCRLGKPLIGLVIALIILIIPGQAQAFFSSLQYETENQGKREIFTFNVPSGAVKPEVFLLDPTTLQVDIRGILSLPLGDFDPEQSRWVDRILIEEMSGEHMGVHMSIHLKEPFLDFRGSLGQAAADKGAPFRLEIEPAPKPQAAGPARLMEGLVLPGRHGTLLIISHTGSGFVEESMDAGPKVVRLSWQGTSLDSRWRDVIPAGLVEGISVYEFSPGQVEMEVKMHPSTEAVRFFRSSEAGTFIMELSEVAARDQYAPTRSAEAREIIRLRKSAAEKGHPRPLNRLTPIFINGSEPLEKNGQEVDESYYMDNARQAVRDHRYPKAKAYLDMLLKLFPDTVNREIVDFYQLDISALMDWKPGWRLAELETTLARYPNHFNYPRYRLMQLGLYNDSSLFENAAGLMCDANLPRNEPAVWLERGRTAMGLTRMTHTGRAQLDKAPCLSPFLPAPSDTWINYQDAVVDAARSYLQKAQELDSLNGPVGAQARFLLARLQKERGDPKGAIAILEETSSQHMSRISERPDQLMEIADLYYDQERYNEALEYYARFLNYYPHLESLAPRAILRVANARTHQGEVEAALLLYDKLEIEYPDSESASWGRIRRLQMEPQLKAFCETKGPYYRKVGQTEFIDKFCKNTRGVEELLAALEKIIAKTSIPSALAEAYLTKGALLGEADRHLEAINALNQLLTLTSRQEPVARTGKLKQKYLVAGMADALQNNRPEAAIHLAEAHGEDWRNHPDYVEAKTQLAEGLQRLGLYEHSLPLLKGSNQPGARELTRFGEAAQKGIHLGISRDADGRVHATPESARVRLDEGRRLVQQKDWEGILILLEDLPDELLNDAGKAERLRLLARAQAERGRFPQAVQSFEELLYQRPMGEGMDHFEYADVLQMWKGDAKALPIYRKVATEAENKELQALARVRIGDILQRSGDLKEARDQYRQVAESEPEKLLGQVSGENAAQLDMNMGMAN